MLSSSLAGVMLRYQLSVEKVFSKQAVVPRFVINRPLIDSL